MLVIVKTHMSDHNPEAWRQNVRAKSKEIQTLIDGVLAVLPKSNGGAKDSEFQAKLATLTEKASAFHYLYAPNLVPQPLKTLSSLLASWKTNVGHAEYTRRVASLYDTIGELADYEEQEASFATIFDKSKDDGDLQRSLDALLEALRSILAEGDEILTKQAADELKVILEQIEKRRKLSLLDLGPWVEFGLVSLGAIVDSVHGTPIGTITVAGLLAAKKSLGRIETLRHSAIQEYFKNLPSKSRNRLNEPLREKLLAASVEELEIHLKEGSGLDRLPAPKPQHLLKDGKESQIS